jgi:hypothetical protein
VPDTLFEEAKRCPKCKQPGEEVAESKAPSGDGVLKFFRCENTRCPEVGERWVVQIRADGTVPSPTDNRGPKTYTKLSNDRLAHGRRIVEDAVGHDMRDSDEAR